MDEFPRAEASQNRRDLEHLKLLSTFHYVGVGLAAVGLLMLYGHFAVFNSMMSNPKLWQAPGAPPPPVEMFAPMKWMYLVFAIGITSTAVLNFLSARFMRARRHRLFSLVVAGINCFYMPLGTILGIFTIVVLVRDSVRFLYQETSSLAR
jgi:putative flippase GtrA